MSTLEAARAQVEAFEQGGVGASVRALRLEGLAPVAAHEELRKRGFAVHALPIPGPRGRTGEPTWLAASGSGLTPKREEAATELAYVHGDGGVVRVFTQRAPLSAYEELTPLPFARKSVLLPLTKKLSFADEACTVTEGGDALPRIPRPAAGLKADPADASASLALAHRVVVASCIRLSEGPPAPAPAAVGSLVGLALGFTLLAKDYWATRELLAARATTVLAGGFRRSVPGGTTVLFPGAGALASARRGIGDRFPCLARLRLLDSAAVVAIEPFGYEASVLQLSSFLGGVLESLDCQVLENTTGRDVTRLAKRHPYDLLGPDGPILHDET